MPNTVIQANAHAQAQAVVARGDLESALPREWLVLWLLVAMAAALGAAVLAGGVVEHRRLQARRVEQWEQARAAQAARKPHPARNSAAAGRRHSTRRAQSSRAPEESRDAQEARDPEASWVPWEAGPLPPETTGEEPAETGGNTRRRPRSG